MATASSLISGIHSALQSLVSVDRTELFLKMGLRNIMVRLVCLRNLGDADNHAMQSLFARIQDAVGRATSAKTDYENMSAIVCLAQEVNDECERHANAISNHLTLDDVVEVAESLLDTTADFWDLAKICAKYNSNAGDLIRHEIDEVEVQIRFLRNFLLLAKRSAVETQQLQTLLIHLRPFVLKATRMFIIDRTSLSGAGELQWDADWVKEVVSKCPRVDPQIFQSYTQFLMSMSTLDQTADATVLQDFLSSLISLLWHILRNHSNTLKPLYECLRLTRFNLKQNNNAQIGVLIRDAGILICSVYFSGHVDSAHLSDLLQRFDVVQAQVLLESSSLSESVMDFAVSTTMEEVIERKVQSDAAMASTQSSSIPQVVGFPDDGSLIEDRIVRGSKQLRLVPICGMAGIGKTTFALEMYNLPSVVYHFQARAWCIISQVFDKKKVMLELLKQIQPEDDLANKLRMKSTDYLDIAEDDLANMLRQSLKGKRYLILLDDVWTPQVWENLGPSFPDDATQSRIVLTSRLHTIIPDEQPHNLRLRTDDQCSKIIEMKSLQAELPQEELKKFASLCKGLPLTAVIVAGLLATSEEEGWEGILNHLSSRGMSGVEQCNIALELSYRQLQDYLKPCFIYFGAFPEDEEIYAEKLIRLWMAEGFVAKRNDLLIQDVGREYLDELIQRNLVMVAGKRSMGGVKRCRIHDLLHDFCLMKGKQENLFHRLLQKDDGLSDFNEPCNLVRLSIHSTAPHFMDSKLFCPHAHSMLFFTPTGWQKLFDMWFIIQIYKHLRVLDMDCIWVCTAIPNEIAHLSGLTYLSIRTYVSVIPSSIGNLSNLETLIIHGGTVSLSLSLPHTIWHLENLKCLYIAAPFTLPIENLESSPDLLELESVCGLLFFCDGRMENLMMKFPNIRKLKCHVICIGENPFVIPGFLTQLESLTLHKFVTRQFQFDFDCGSTAKNLRKVALKGFLLSREEIAVMGKLPILEVLKLERIDFLEGKMEMEEGEFLKLRVLKLIGSEYLGSKLKMWTAIGDDILPCLEKLAFRCLKNLEEIPCSCLKDSSTLVEVDVFRSSRTLESLVRNIEEAQRDFGNSIRVQISGQEE